MKYLYLRYGCLCIALLVLAGTPAFGDDITQADIDDYGAVYNYLKWECSLKNNEYTLRHWGKVTIYNVRGESYGDIVIREHSSEKLDNVRVRVVDANGKEIFKRDKGDLERICGYGSYAVYKDICYYQSSIDVAQFPFSVIYEYEKKGKAMYLWPGPYMQLEIPVEQFDYLVTGKDRVPFRYRQTGSDTLITPIVSDTSLEWKLENIPAYTEPKYAAHGYGEQARLEFEPEKFSYEGWKFEGDSWEDIARWYHELAENRYTSPQIPTRPIPDTAAFIKATYDEVRSSVRYVSVQIGIGGWQPHEAEKTYERKYGDCKDMSTLLVSLLRSRGVEAYPVLVRTRDLPALDVDFPSFAFNHVITCVIRNADTVWMDPTCSYCPFGEMGRLVEDIPVLIVTEDGGRLVRTPAKRADQNRLTIETDMTVTPDRLATAELTLTATGNRAIYLRGRLSGEKEEDMWSFLKSYIPELSGPYDMLGVSLKYLEDVDSAFAIDVGVRRVKPFRIIGKVMYIDAFPFSPASGIEDVDLEDRDVPLEPVYPRMTGSTMHITLDPALTFDSIAVPDTVIERHSFGYAHFSASADGPEITSRIDKGYYPRIITADQFDEFSDWCDALKTLRKQYIKIYR